jgi:hypothetical protein
MRTARPRRGRGQTAGASGHLADRQEVGPAAHCPRQGNSSLDSAANVRRTVTSSQQQCAARHRSHERRLCRSGDTLVALRRLLDSARRRGGLSALVVADETGCLVAGSGVASACEVLAAWAPLISRCPPAANDTVPTRLDVLATRSEARGVTVDGIRVLICGRGDPGLRAAALEEAAAGCARILGSRRRQI